MSHPDTPNSPPGSGASAFMPFGLGHAPVLTESDTRQIGDTRWVNLERRADFLRHHLANHRVWLSGDTESLYEYRRSYAEYHSIEQQLGRRLPTPLEYDGNHRPLSRMPASSLRLDSSRAPEERRHNSSAYPSGESDAILLQPRRGEDVFPQVSPYTSNPLEPLALPQAETSLGLRSDWPGRTLSPALHNERSSSNSASVANPAGLRADVPSFSPRQAAPPPVLPFRPAWPSSINAYANPYSANSATPVAPTHIEPMITHGYLGERNPINVARSSGAYSRSSRPVLPTPGRDNLRRSNSEQRSPSGSQPGERVSPTGSEIDLLDPTQVEFPNGTLRGALERVLRDRVPPSPILPRESNRPRIFPTRPTGLDVDDDRPPPKTAEELKVNLDCKICYTQRSSVVLIPCGKKFSAPLFFGFDGHWEHNTNRTLCDVQMVCQPCRAQSCTVTKQAC